MAFYGCSGLTSIVIPDNVSLIEHDAFYGCEKLGRVVIGSRVTTIEQEVFANCQDLTDVYCSASAVPTTNATAFNGSITVSKRVRTTRNI